MVNQTIQINASRLNIPTATVHVRAGHSTGLGFTGAPRDVTGLFVRIFTTGGAYFDVAANEHPNGAWTAYVIGTCFPDEGSFHYEVHATDAQGNPTALGYGSLDVEAFSVTASPVKPGSAITVAQIPTADGAMVQVQMVQDEDGQWVYQAVV